MHKQMSHQARVVTYQAAERMSLLRGLSIPERSAVFQELSPYVQQAILSQLKDYELVELLDNMDMDQVERSAALIGDVKRRKRIIGRLKGEIREKLEYFLRFHPQASLSLITFNYLFLSATVTIGEAAAAIDSHYEEVGKYPELLVHDRGRLIGEVPFAAMVRERNSSQLKKHTHELPTIAYQSEVSHIVNTLTTTKSKKIVVLDHDGSVLGVIYADAAKALFENLPEESLYDFAGVDSSERVRDSVAAKVKNRYKWLIINLGTGFLAASVVGLFENTLNQVILLAIYMPIVAGMGGNAATQTLAVTVRGISTGEINLRTSFQPIFNEVCAGLINGLINGVLVALVAIFWNQNPLLGLVIGIAMVVNLIIAGFFGAFIPLVMKALGKDPATSATIFITTATDVFGFFVFLGLATILLV